MSFQCYMSGVEGRTHYQACVDAGVKHVLLSFLYMEKSDLATIRRRKQANPDIKFMIDSGAHTFQSDKDSPKPKYANWRLSDYEAYIKRYVKWLRDNKDYIESAVELDIDWNVGTAVVESWQKKYFIPLMEEGINMIFVWHKQRGLEGYEEMCSKFPYVGLPGEFSSEPDFNKYMTVARRYMTRVHGFAATKQMDFRDWPWYCMTEDHEILTPLGWKHRKDIAVGDLVLTYAEGKSKWEPVEKVHQFEVQDTRLVEFKHRNFSAKVTPNHKWLSNRAHGRKRDRFTPTWRTTDELDSCDRIPRRADFQGNTDKVFSDSFVELAAWLWTEGSYSRGRIHISQSRRVNPTKVKRIRHALIKEGAKFCEWDNEKDGCTYFQISGSVLRRLHLWMPEKTILFKFLNLLTVEQLQLFVYVSKLADGTDTYRVCKGIRPTFELSQKNGRNIDAFEYACILAGYPVNRFYVDNNGYKAEGVSTSNVDYINPYAAKRTEYRYTGTVWCVTVKNSTFLTRCKGTVYWTGNSGDSTTWKTSEIYGTLIHWDEHAQKIVFDEDKSRRSLYREHFLTAGLNADAIIDQTDYREVTKYALYSMRRMAVFYEKKYTDRTFYYELRLPHPKAVHNLSDLETLAVWQKFRPATKFPSHAAETDPKKVRSFLRALACVQYGDLNYLASLNPRCIGFLESYFPNLAKPLTSDVALFQKEVASYTMPANPPALDRLDVSNFVSTNNPPKDREEVSLTADDLDWDVTNELGAKALLPSTS